jgi:hypothetical protein
VAVDRVPDPDREVALAPCADALGAVTDLLVDD